MELEHSVEQLEHADHAQHTMGVRSRLRIVATVLIVLATAVGAAVSYLATRANTHAEEAGRARQIQVALDQREKSRVGGLDSSAEESAILQGDLSTAAVALGAQLDSAPAAESDAIGAQLVRLVARSEALAKHDMTDAARAAENRPGNEAHQRALSLGESTEVWVHKEDVYVGILGVLAVALFLLGLSMTVPTMSIRIGFIALATVLGVVSLARAVATERIHQPSLNKAALTAYLDGRQHDDAGKHVAALTDLRRATSIDPEYSQAWLALGDALMSGEGSDREVGEALEAYTRARETGTKTADLLNSQAFSALLLGKVDQASASLDALGDRAGEDIDVLSTRAEIALGRHNLREARRLLDLAIEQLKSVDAEYRDFFLDQQQGDRERLATHKVGTDAERTSYFDAMRDEQASLDAFGEMEPRDLHGARLSAATLSYDDNAARLHYSVTETGHRAGDVISVRVLEDGEFSPDYSPPVVTPSGGARVVVSGDAPLYAGTYDVQVFLNGHFQSEQEFTVKD